MALSGHRHTVLMTRHDPLLSVAFTAACLFHSDKEAQPLSSQSVGEVRRHHSWRWPYHIAGLSRRAAVSS